jgi:cation transport ATPase
MNVTSQEDLMSTTTATYAVSGMTCSHCVTAVTEEVSQLDGVSAGHGDQQGAAAAGRGARGHRRGRLLAGLLTAVTTRHFIPRRARRVRGKEVGA